MSSSQVINSYFHVKMIFDSERPLRLVPPISLALSGAIGGGAKKRLVAPSLSLTLSHDGFSAAALSATPDETPSLSINLEALETPSDSETGTLPENELEWDGESLEFITLSFCSFRTF